MKPMHLLAVIAIIAAAISLTGCHTNEKIWAQSAGKVTHKMQQTGGIDSTVYAKIRKEARPSVVKVGNDTMALVTQSIHLTADQPDAQLKRYNVVVAQFKQLFNARSMRNRLYAAGYVNPYIVETNEPLYYVVAEGCDELHQAYGLLH
ncbi:MAG: hypothetical protein K2L93_08070, partial [Muribaculaceae bacterium]|nr:hypothetical protein [Muribaculaceae bacterium]